jgi:hypothetical protein
MNKIKYLSLFFLLCTHYALEQATQKKQPNAPKKVVKSKAIVSPKKHNPAALKKTAVVEIKPVTKKIKNSIVKQDIGYYKMFKWHYPDVFVLKVNDQPVESGKQLEVNSPKITVRYDYEWSTPWGKKINGKQATFEIPDTMQEVTIKFLGWQEEERIHIEGAKKITEEKLILPENDVPIQEVKAAVTIEVKPT